MKKIKLRKHNFPKEIKNHAGYRYMLDILNGKIVSGKYCKWMALRQYNDLIDSPKRGFIFVPEVADMVMDVMRGYRHFKGDFSGQYFEPTPSQAFFFWCLFGWLKQSDGKRRFREVYKEVARKNGKSFEAAAVGAYFFEADNEPSSECYTAATKLKQARIIHENVKAIINESPDVKSKATILRDNITIKSTYSKFEPLGKESQTEDGLNPHYASLDEYHAAKDDGMYKVIDSAFGGRSQPLFYIITTAGTNPQGPCYQHREYCLKVLNPDYDVHNDELLVAIYTIDEEDEDDIFNEDIWEKANPNMPYIPTILTKLRGAAEKAKEKPSDLVNFKTKHLNVWCSSEHPWLDITKWNNAPSFDEKALIGRKCYAGLDLASVNDLTALTLVFPPEQESIPSQRDKFRKAIIEKKRDEKDGLSNQAFSLYLDEVEDEIEAELRDRDYIIPDPYKVIPFFFVPDEGIDERSKSHGVDYNIWRMGKEHNFFATPGVATDYNFVEYQIDKLNALYQIQEIVYDPHNARMLIQALMNKDYTCVEMAQTWANMSPVSKDFEALVLMQLIAHNNNPVLTWNAGNVIVHHGPSGNYKPDKRNSKEKIDGIISLLMGLKRCTDNEIKLKTSMYESGGLFGV